MEKPTSSLEVKYTKLSKDVVEIEMITGNKVGISMSGLAQFMDRKDDDQDFGTVTLMPWQVEELKRKLKV